MLGKELGVIQDVYEFFNPQFYIEQYHITGRERTAARALAALMESTGKSVAELTPDDWGKLLTYARSKDPAYIQRIKIAYQKIFLILADSAAIRPEEHDEAMDALLEAKLPETYSLTEPTEYFKDLTDLLDCLFALPINSEHRLSAWSSMSMYLILCWITGDEGIVMDLSEDALSFVTLESSGREICYIKYIDPVTGDFVRRLIGVERAVAYMKMYTNADGYYRIRVEKKRDCGISQAFYHYQRTGARKHKLIKVAENGRNKDEVPLEDATKFDFSPACARFNKHYAQAYENGEVLKPKRFMSGRLEANGVFARFYEHIMRNGIELPPPEGIRPKACARLMGDFVVGRLLQFNPRSGREYNREVMKSYQVFYAWMKAFHPDYFW